MTISEPGVLREAVGDKELPLLLRNSEIERFEERYAPFGIYGLWDQLNGRGSAPQVRHVRDLIALGLVGAGMADRAADKIIGDLPPSENLNLRATAARLLMVTFVPAVLSDDTPKKEGGSPPAANGDPEEETDTTSPDAS